MIDLWAQCPCSGGGGVDPLYPFAVVVAMFAMFRWFKAIGKQKGKSSMNKAVKIGIVLALAIVVVAVLVAKSNRTEPQNAPPAAAPAQVVATQPAQALPRLVDLGAGKCIPCKMMAPILEELRAEYAGRLRVDFYDVWETPGIAQQYGVRVIPTQVFYDGAGTELWRHEGFMAKDDILAKWRELGVDLQTPDAKVTPAVAQ